MTRRFRPTDAFVDESIRGQRYYMGCVLAEARNLASIRRGLAGLVLTGGRVHFHNESAQRRRMILGEFAHMPVSAFAVICQRRHGVTEFQTRERCLEAVVRLVQSRAIPRLVIESRHDDRDDRRVIEQTRQAAPLMTYEHRLGSDEPMLWLADGVAWAVGAGATWRALLGHVLSEVVELRP